MSSPTSGQPNDQSTQSDGTTAPPGNPAAAAGVDISDIPAPENNGAPPGDGAQPAAALAAATGNPHRPPTRKVSNISMPKQKSGIFGASSNLVNSIVGAGIIGIPYAIDNAGFIAGVLLLILVGYLTDKSLRIIVELASFHPKLKNLGVLTFEDLMSVPYGSTGKNFILAGMFILAYGAMVAYLIIIKDTVPVVLGVVEASEDGTPEEGTFWERDGIMLIFSLIIILPLSLMRDMASLAFTSLLSVLSDVILVIVVLAYVPYTSSVSDAGGFGQVVSDNWINGKLFIGLGVLSTAMACQHSAFIVSGSLEDRTAERWAMVTFRSLSIATFLCLILGVFGYLGYLDETQGNILNNFEADSKAANCGRVVLALTMFFTYPMELFVARHVIAMWVFIGDLDNEGVGPNGETIPEQKSFGCIGRREMITLLLYVATLIPAFMFDDLGPVLSLTGSLGASCVAYIGPGLAYLGVNGDDFLAYLARKLENQGYKDKKASTSEAATGQIELPVVGDAGATMQTAPEATHPSDVSGMRKPIWWWLGGYPLWTALASTGAHGTRQFLLDYQNATGEPVRPAQVGIIGPCRRDYYISIFMIIFGVISLVVGFASNIYVEVHDEFYTPT